MKTSLLILVFLTVSIMIPANSFAEPPTKTENDSYEGTIEWMSRCFMIGSTITVRVTDYDMNDDPNKIEQFNVKVWSDYDLESDFEDRIIDYTVTETGVNTGVFDSSIFLTTTDDSPGNRIRVIDNSTVFAKYVDYTVPNVINSDVTSIFTVSGLSVLERTDDSRMSKITYDPCAIVLFEKNKEKFNELDIFYPTPIKQIESGLFLFEIKCKDYLELIFKNSDSSPACVKPETKLKLIDREWTDFVPIQPEIGKFGTYDLQKNDQTFEIKYEIEGGNITKISPDYNQMMISVMIESHYDGSLQITIPREVIDATIGGFDDDFFVLVDGIQVDFSEKSNEIHRKLTIEFNEGVRLIEIIGTNPDF